MHKRYDFEKQSIEILNHPPLPADMDPDEIIAAVEDLDIDDLADLVEDLPDTVIDEVLKSMDRENRERLEQVLSYDEDSAGRLMNPDVVTVRADTTVDVVLRYLRLRGEGNAGEKFLSFLNFDILFHFAYISILSYFCFFKEFSISFI